MRFERLSLSARRVTLRQPFLWDWKADNRDVLCDHCLGCIFARRRATAHCKLSAMKPILAAALAALISSADYGLPMSDPKIDCESLMSAALPLAEKMLLSDKEFYPYGSAMKPNGEIVSVAGYDGRGHPSSADIIRLLKDGFIDGARTNKYKATALVYDVRVTLPSSEKKSDAIAVALNHRDNYSVIVFFPYQIDEGRLKIGDAFAQKGEADIFPSK